MKFCANCAAAVVTPTLALLCVLTQADAGQPPVSGDDAGYTFTKGLRLVKLAASLGGVESMALHPASTSHRQLDADALRAAGITEGTIRLSVGIEQGEGIWSDIAQALP